MDFLDGFKIVSNSEIEEMNIEFTDDINIKNKIYDLLEELERELDEVEED